MTLHKSKRSPGSEPGSDICSESRKTQLGLPCSAKKYIK